MRWFKHFTDNHRGRSVQTLMDQMGHAGLGIYILMELCAEKLHKDSGNKLTSSDLVFRFHPRVLDNALRMKRKSTENILRISQECNLLKYVYSQNEVIIEMPILLDLLEKNYKKSPLRGIKVSKKLPLDTDTDTDTDTEQIHTLKKAKTNSSKKLPATKNSSISTQAKALRDDIWNAYYLGYKEKYNTEPVRNAKINAIVSQLEKRLGKEAPDVVAHYLKHTDRFYIQKMHDLGLCLKDAEALRTQWAKGIVVTERRVKEFTEKLDVEEKFERTLEFAREYDRQVAAEKQLMIERNNDEF